MNLANKYEVFGEVGSHCGSASATYLVLAYTAQDAIVQAELYARKLLFRALDVGVSTTDFTCMELDKAGGIILLNGGE